MLFHKIVNHEVNIASEGLLILAKGKQEQVKKAINVCI